MVHQRHILLVLSAAAVLLLGGCQWTWRARTPVEARRPIDLADAGPTVAQRATLDAAAAARAGGDYEQALRLFREILAENPMATTAYVGIGDIQLEQQNYEDAERQFGQAARLGLGSLAAQCGGGGGLQMCERFVEAVKAYHRALTIRPEDFDANHQLAATYLRMGKATNAVVFAEKAVDVRPDDGAARADLGAAYASVGRHADAIVQYQAAMERIDPTPDLLMSLVNALAAEQRYHEAVNTTEFLVRLAPSADAYERLGWGAFRIGDY
ncbi:MAG: tetratricopeptide repeat protein, partial [Phycisphaerales bacterium]|nr:tetratricopeptide repeat protein [Phycisphaerales bacterium]